MVGEHFEIDYSEMSKNHQLSTMVGENFKIEKSEMSKINHKLSTMVGENFEIDYSEMSKNHQFSIFYSCKNLPTWGASLKNLQE